MIDEVGMMVRQVRLHHLEVAIGSADNPQEDVVVGDAVCATTRRGRPRNGWEQGGLPGGTVGQGRGKGPRAEQHAEAP